MRTLVRGTVGLLWLIAIGAAVTHLLGVLPPREMQARLGGPELFETHFADFARNPLSTYIHMVSGIVLAALMPVQFSERLRRTHLSLHRAAGKLLVGSGVLAAATGAYFSIVMPFGGVAETLLVVPMAAFFVWCLVRGVRLAQAGQVQWHRRWMIRAMAVALGVATQRVLFSLAMMLLSWPAREAFWISIAAAFALNLAVAESFLRRRT